MTVYWGHELPDLAECSVGNRAVTQMPSGMEKEEEMESHLQDAILAQQASTSGVQVNHVIPTPKVDHVEDDRYHSTYHNRNKAPRTKYIKVHAWQALERDEPEYDYDTEDEAWLAEHTHVEPRILEKIFDTVESHSSETQIASEDSVINFHKSLDSSIVYEVYEYWVTKRTSAATTSGCVGVGGLIPKVRTECRKDGQGAVNPYVAFRRRAEKMQTRKNRKNDEDSYEKILKLVHDMSKAQQLFDMTARREKQKLALIDMESEILLKRMEMSDFGAASSSAFNELTEKIRSTTEVKPLSEINGTASSQEESGKKKKRQRRKVTDKDLISKAWLKKNAESWNRPPALFAQNGVVPAVTTKPAKEVLLDGKYSFKRRRGCVYRAAIVNNVVPPTPTFVAPSTAHASPFIAPAPISSTPSTTATVPPTPTILLPVPSTSSASSTSSKQSEPVPNNLKYYETFLPDTSGSLRSFGFTRRRLGRGGRVFFDRMPRNRDPTPIIDPWAEYCVADNTKTYRAQISSLATEEETEELSPKTRYFARSNRVRYDDAETEREWSSRYESTWKDTEVDEEPSEKSDLSKEGGLKKPSETSVAAGGGDNDDSEVERMDVDGKEEDTEVLITNGNGCDRKNEEDDEEEEDVGMDMDVDDHLKVHRLNGSGGLGKLKPLQEHSPPLSGNGRADRAEPTPVPAKMCGTVSDSDDWREPSGSPSESNSSTEWGGYTTQNQHTAVVVVAAYKEKLMNVDVEEDDDEHQQQQALPARGARDHSIKEFFDVNGNNAGTKKPTIHDAFDNRDVDV
uniref:Enhancer of polycomb-like protein n=1 Tax=Caenorhabditis tropicalis TaxID=1561998 RepID=A0A1I7UZH3_9PELO